MQAMNYVIFQHCTRYPNGNALIFHIVLMWQTKCFAQPILILSQHACMLYGHASVRDYISFHLSANQITVINLSMGITWTKKKTHNTRTKIIFHPFSIWSGTHCWHPMTVPIQSERQMQTKCFWRDLFWQLRPDEQIHRKRMRKRVSFWSFIDSARIRPPVISDKKHTHTARKKKPQFQSLFHLHPSKIHHQTAIVWMNSLLAIYEYVCVT